MRYNFPEELLYDNIARKMDGRTNLIANRGSIFPHGNIDSIGSELMLPEQNDSDEELKKYIESLPDTFDKWIK